MTSRRDFLKAMGVAGLSLTGINNALAMPMSSKEWASAKSEKLKIAYIGIGNRGEQNISEFAKKYHRQLTGLDSGAAEIRLFAHKIKLRLRKHGSDGILKQLFRNLFRIVAVQQAHLRETLNAEKAPCFAQQSLCFVVQAGLLLDKYTINHVYSPFTARRARCPMSLRQ